MDLSDRKKQILQMIVEGYIRTAEPVGSRSISKNSELNLSAATIRNEMGDLEEMGLIEQPHASAGRKPSNLGYRVYVDSLMSSYKMTASEMRELQRAMELKAKRLEDIARSISHAFSSVTHMPTVASLPGSDEVYMQGTPNILRFPEYSDVGKAREILEFLLDMSSMRNVLDLLGGEGNTKVVIGDEALIPQLKDASVILSRYSAGANIAGVIGVIAPTRVDYSEIVSKLEYFTERLSKVLEKEFIDN